MFEDKVLVCKECGQEFVFSAGEQEFYAERGFQNEAPALQAPAVTPARTRPAVPVSSSPLSAPCAAARRRFPSSPSPTVPCTAA
ncbi:MAG: zinc-ribbon domain-containing protein [Lachnospiraceae bacterium]